MAPGKLRDGLQRGVAPRVWAPWVAPPVKVAAAIDMSVCFYPGFSRLRCPINFSVLKTASLRR